MRVKIILLAILLSNILVIDLFSQEMPFVYGVENTGADCPKPPLLTFAQLPSITALPDPFSWADGRGRISSLWDWRCRRNEIKTEIEHYEIGEKPVRPEDITASYADGTLIVNITVNGNTLTLTSAVELPSGDGPFPAVIGMGGGSGSLPPDIFTTRDIAQISFNFGQVMAHTQTRGSEPINELYPELTYMGAYSAWSWGVSRLIDGLELVSADLNIDLEHLAVTGCSFAGKMALFAGAFDERIALTIAQEPGGGGAAAWRVSQTLGGVETLGATSHAWFIEDMFQFSSAVSKLPHDHHELMTMVAPRALLVLGNPDYEWLAEESGYVSSRAAHEVWKALGVPERFGFSILGGHSHCALPNVQKPEVEAFVDAFLLGDSTANTDDITTHIGYTSNLSSWIPWSTPVLIDKPSYFTQAPLIFPANLQINLEKIIPFRWNHVEDADMYFIELSSNPTFSNIITSDSIGTDTTKTISDLLDNKKYFWRVQVRNIDGTLGPWSEVWNFYTFVDNPESPQLVAANLIQNRKDYIKLIWNKVDGADKYIIQISVDENFTTLFDSDSTTSDTLMNFKGLTEGQNYYWRIQAKNVAGFGPWSEVSKFTIIRAPRDLSLQITSLSKITLTWTDVSPVDDGYVIERKEGTQTSFTIIDTLKESGSEYVDNNVEENKTYVYRIKAYKESAESEYSNEASLVLVGVADEIGMPTEYSISQNYPNPFNPTTNIKFTLPKAELTKIIIYDLLGREIQTLLNRELAAGYHEVSFNANNFADGVYFYRMESGNFTDTKKLVLIK